MTKKDAEANEAARLGVSRAQARVVQAYDALAEVETGSLNGDEQLLLSAARARVHELNGMLTKRLKELQRTDA